MRFSLNLTIVSVAIVIFSGCLLSTASAQNPQAFVQVNQLIKQGKKDAALKAFSDIVSKYQRSDPETAAEALYQEGLYTQSPAYAGNEKELEDGQDKAVAAWQQISNNYPNTKAASKILSPINDFQRSPLGILEAKIDKRNSTGVMYQIINSLVKLTGSHPNYSYWIAIILLAILVKVLLIPLTRKQYVAMREMQRMQPLIKELQKKYKGQELSQKQMELYKEHGVNPFASCLPSLLQFPFLILIYRGIIAYQYAFVNGKFLWVGSPISFKYPHYIATSLAQPDIPLLVIYTLTNYLTMRLMPAQDPAQQSQTNMMALMTSGMFFYMFLIYRWSSAFVLYWLALNAISIWQQYIYVFRPQRLSRLNQLAADGAASQEIITTTIVDNPSKSVTELNGKPARVRPRKKKR